MNKDNLAGLGLGLFLGAIIGGTIALLYAPQEGAKTRTLIKEKAYEANTKARVIRDRVTGKFKPAKGE